MTQKELLYFEDAIAHEANMIKIIEAGCKNLTDDNLKNFMNDELSKHNKMKQALINLLEEKINE